MNHETWSKLPCFSRKLIATIGPSVKIILKENETYSGIDKYYNIGFSGIIQWLYLLIWQQFLLQCNPFSLALNGRLQQETTSIEKISYCGVRYIFNEGPNF